MYKPLYFTYYTQKKTLFLMVIDLFILFLDDEDLRRILINLDESDIDCNDFDPGDDEDADPSYLPELEKCQSKLPLFDRSPNNSDDSSSDENMVSTVPLFLPN